MADLRRARRGGAAKKLEAKLAEGDYYEALQIYKTLFSRHEAKGEHEEAMRVAAAGVKKLLEHESLNGGAELGLMMVENWIAHPRPVADDSVALVTELQAAFPEGAEQFKERLTFLRAALKWSTRVEGGRPSGAPAVHAVLARALREAGPSSYAAAAEHYARAEAPEELADLLLAWSAGGYASERDLFLARAVLTLLTHENLRDANATFASFRARCEAAGAPLDTPLSNFIGFLLQTCEREAAPLFQMLQQRYARSLQRDPEFAGMLRVIGEKFFGMRPAPNMMSMLSGMLGGGS